ncbi:MAG TPA: hypothetical protein ACFYEM_11340, partial [Candidatus Hypogeohydataceae bacterium YC40]
GAIFVDELCQDGEGQDMLKVSRGLKTMRMMAETLHTVVVCTLATSDKALMDLDSASKKQLNATVLLLSTPGERGSGTLKSLWPYSSEGQKEFVVNIQGPSEKEVTSPIKLYIKPGGKIVEQG